MTWKLAFEVKMINQTNSKESHTVTNQNLLPLTRILKWLNRDGPGAKIKVGDLPNGYDASNHNKMEIVPVHHLYYAVKQI